MTFVTCLGPDHTPYVVIYFNRIAQSWMNHSLHIYASYNELICYNKLVTGNLWWTTSANNMCVLLVATMEAVFTGREKLELLLETASVIVAATSLVAGTTLVSLNTSLVITTTEPWLENNHNYYFKLWFHQQIRFILKCYDKYEQLNKWLLT